MSSQMICNSDLELFDLSNNDTLEALETLISISNRYEVFHKYISLFICIIGMIMNALHVIVLTRPAMYRSTVNRLLTLVAICDIVTMLSYLIFTIRFSFMVDTQNPPLGYELKSIVFLLVHVVLSIGLHSITLFLSVATAYIRYKALDKLDSKLMNKNAAGPIFVVISVLVTLLCIPTFLVHSIVAVEGPQKEVLYTVGIAEFGWFNSCTIFKLNLWLTGICFKVIPCLLLVFFTVALCYKLKTIRIRRHMITSGNSLAAKKCDAHSDRTTKLLITLLIIFTMTELPQGILAVANGIYPNDIHQFVYLSLGDILDLLSLINCNSCYLLYPLISTQYRNTLQSIIRCVRKTYRKRLESASKLKKLHGETSILRFNDDQDVLL